MPTQARAWFLYAGSGRDVGQLAELRHEEFELRDIDENEVLAEPLFGSWSGNMNHAMERKPIDICRHRGEERVVLGNAGVVRVLQVGAQVKTLRPGQYAFLFSASVLDRWGYPEKALAFDAPGTMGCLATRIILRPHELVPLPENTRFSLPQWAAFSGNYVTAWSNWVQAYGCFRLLLDEDEFPSPNVWGWGGGTTLAELELAKRHGCSAVMMSASDRRLALIQAAGLVALDRRQFGELSYDERRFSTEPSFRRAYLDAESRFLREVDARTGGDRVQIFVDYIGTPVYRATLKALGRQGVITTAGWKEGMAMAYLRAVECIGRHQHVHTHYARYSQGLAATAYAEAQGWMPRIDERIYTFDEVPELARDFSTGNVGFFTLFSVNPV